jgi:hypothetical protein
MPSFAQPTASAAVVPAAVMTSLPVKTLACIGHHVGRGTREPLADGSSTKEYALAGSAYDQVLLKTRGGSYAPSVIRRRKARGNVGSRFVESRKRVTQQTIRRVAEALRVDVRVAISGSMVASPLRCVPSMFCGCHMLRL